MTATQTNLSALIHAARIDPYASKSALLLLRKIGPKEFKWFLDDGTGCEQETTVEGENVETAIRNARRHWKHAAFRTLNCGFRYSLPERDEHGTNALFFQMMLSYSSPNGVYFDEELGSNCFVQAASDEAKDLWKKLKLESRL